jgi:RNA polymerase sigma factor (sigma-70 family)
VNRLLAEVPDQDLLGRYVQHREQEAFAQLVARYNRLVWGQCRNLLANDADAEDAFQATFLTLARSANSLRPGRPLGPWLHGVAYRVCMNARRAIGRRAKREKASARPDAHQPVADSSWEKALAMVAEEVQRLPEAQRAAFVLCCLEGRPVADAAAGLGLKLGTFAATLSRAKQALLDRLAKRGLGAGALALSVVAGSAAGASASLVERTLALLPPGTVIPDFVRVLTHGATGMATIPFKLLAATSALVAVVLVAGGGWRPGSVAAAPVPKVLQPENKLLTPDARNAIDAGLEYLAKHQKEDGSWATDDSRGTVALTALSGRAFLAAGHQPGRGPFGTRLAQAIEFVLRSEGAGLLAKGNSAPMCEHGFAVRFLAEALGGVADVDLKRRMKAALTRAVKVIADGQNREGGWRYRPNSKDSDIVATCCQLHALAAARRAGVEVPQTTIDDGIKYVLTCRDAEHGDQFQYMPRIPSVPAAAFEYTAAAISALKAVGFKDDTAMLEDGTQFIRGFKSPGASDVYFFNSRFDAASLMKVAGNDWEAWYSTTRDDLLARRNKDGVWGDAKTSTFDTADALLILQTAK